MITKQFLETYPLYRKMEFEIPYYQTTVNDLQTPAINMACKKCKSMQTFNIANEIWELRAHNEPAARRTDIWNIPIRLVYRCSACDSYSYYFFIQFVPKDQFKVEDTTFYKAFVRKIGQIPSWKIDVDKNIEKALGGEAELYNKGLTNESQGYGIGAYAYFRRITEIVIDQLLRSISDLIDEKDKEEYGKALEEVKKTRVTEEKIELVQDLLPSSLKPDGYNPLKALHAALSDGIHNKTDEECLELADTIRTVLVYLLEEIRSHGERSKHFSERMKKLLKEKQP